MGNFASAYSAVRQGIEARRLAEERKEERRRQEEERRRKLGLLEALPETMGSYLSAQEGGRAVEVPIESQATGPIGLEAGLPLVSTTTRPWESSAEMLRESPQARQAAGQYYQAIQKWPWETGGPMESVEVARERTEKRQRQQETRALAVSALDLLESPDDDDKMKGWYLMRRVDAIQGEASKKWVEEGIRGEEERRKAKSWVTKTYAPYWQVLAQGGKTTAEQDLAFLADTFPVARDVPAIADELKVWSKRFQRDHDPAVQAGGRYTELRLQGREHRSAMAQVMRENPNGWLQMLTLGEEYVPAALKPHLKEAFQTEKEREKEETERKTKAAGLRRGEAEATKAERALEGGGEPRNLAEAQRMLNEALRSMNPENLRLIDPEDRPAVTSAAQEQIRYLQDWIAKHRGGGAPPAPTSQTPWDQLAPEQKRARADLWVKRLYKDKTWATLTPEQKARVLQELR